MMFDGKGFARGGNIAVVGMAVRVPGASNVQQYWENLRNGLSAIRRLDPDTLKAAGVPEAEFSRPDYVPYAAQLDGFADFDAEFFGLSPKEAAVMDPQHRQFLETVWEAMEHAGHPPESVDGNVGVFAGCGMGTYFYVNVCSHRDLVNETGMFLLRHTGNDKDFLSTRVSHAFDLKGPSIGLQTACSTSLVAIHYAAQSLASGDCDMALAGGVTIELPQGRGYLYRKDEILSPDGTCRAFDHKAAGTVFGSGAGVVVLRRLEDAIADGDRIWAVIKGSAVNNDGAVKASYLAPSVEGQASAIVRAHTAAGISADTVGYLECHGTGTYLGDPIEVAALTDAFRETTDATDFCRIGSVKTNIGHLRCNDPRRVFTHSRVGDDPDVVFMFPGGGAQYAGMARDVYETNGRAGLAIASGWHPDDFVLRPENAPPANKPAVFDAIRDLRDLWSGKPLTMTRADGTRVEKLTQPRPVSKDLPLWLTIAGNPDAFRQAGEAGLNVLTHLLGQSIEDVAERIRIYHDALRASGRDPADHTVTLMLHTFLAETREQSREIAREPMKAYLKAAADLIKQYAWAFPAFKRPAGVATPRDLDLGTLSPDEMDDILEFAFQRYFENSGLFGTFDDAMARVSELSEIGVTEVACLIDYGIERQTILDGLTRLAEVRAAANAGPAEADYSIAAQIARHGVTHLQCTPYMARMLLENPDSRAALARIRNLLIGGEALPAALVAGLREATSARIDNMYGPTETTIWSATGAAEADGAFVPVGTPIANTRCYVLDGSGQPVGIGETGELFIGGDGVARGYLNRPDLTAEKFLPNPFHAGRMFATGDLARWRADGSLVILGRRDTQVKVRGYRIEIGEIEAAMERVPGVNQAVAVVRPDASGVGQIFGYVTGPVAEADIRAALGRSLPDYMVPMRVISLAAMPLTPNRKIDRNALPKPGARAPLPPDRETKVATSPARASRSVTLDELTALWSDVLGVVEVSASDSFFDLGGHSLLAIEVHRRIKSELGVTGLSIADIFRKPTLGGLHALLANLGRDTAPMRPAVVPKAPVPTASVTAVAQAVSDADIVARRRALRASRSAMR